ncbi:MAG: penicillin-binding transpeptidase domain-containing protein [Actinomycetes bacterium]
MNTQIRRLGIGLLACYLALFVMLNWIQVFQKDSLDANAFNTLQVKQDFNKPRGTISAADGVLLAESVETAGTAFKRQRVYPTGDLFAQLTGFYSFTYGSTGLEKTYDEVLAGNTIGQQVRGFADVLNPRPQVGNLTLSVRDDLQQAAKAALGDREGSVVAIDPRTGELLAFWSYPSFDPNLLAANDQDVAAAARTVLLDAPGQPLRAHQYQERYFPGSTFKVVTGSTGVQTGKVTLEDPSYPVATGYRPPGTTKTISNFGGESCGGTLVPILRLSCNSAFAEMGTETIGPTDMIAGAQAFGFNAKPPIDLPAPVESVFPTDFTRNLPALAQASIGQNDVQATPLEMALVAAAIANQGSIMKPHVMREVRDSEGTVIQRYDIGSWLHPLSAESAATMRVAMLDVVARGTATRLQIAGYEVGGKTGTAQIGLEPPTSHTWIMGFAGPPGGEPQIAISVVVLNQPGVREATGGLVAAPVAQQVMSTYLAAIAAGH